MVERGRNIRQLTGLRGVAALGVVIKHAADEAGASWSLPGQPMVDIFFVLSGFVMAYVYIGRPLNWLSFAQARFARIYPLHIATALLITIAAIIVARMNGDPLPDRIAPGHALDEIFLTSTIPVIGGEQPWNFVSWSISVEWWVYFTLFPLLVYFGQRLPRRLAMAIVLPLAAALAVSLYESPSPTGAWIAFARALIGFGGGWVAFRFAVAKGNLVRSGLTSLLAVAILIAIYAVPMLTRTEAWYMLPVYPLLIYCLATDDDGPASRFLAWQPVKWLGDISFSLYLIHPIIVNLLFEFDARVIAIGGPVNWLVVTLVLAITISAMSFYWFEMPMRRWLHPRPSPSSAARRSATVVE